MLRYLALYPGKVCPYSAAPVKIRCSNKEAYYEKSTVEEGLEYPKLRPVQVVVAEHEGSPVYLLTDPLGLSTNPVGVSPAAFELLKLFDGTNKVEDIQAAATRMAGSIVFRADIENLIKALDNEYVLDNDRFRSKLSELEKEYVDAPVRKASFSGAGYPDDAEELGKLLDSFTSDKADQPEPGQKPGDSPCGAVIPHIDPARGGSTYGAVYKEMIGMKEPDTFIILGTCHQASDRMFILTGKDYETPLGTVRSDTQLLELIEKETGGCYQSQEWLHKQEHSIEFQVLFIARYFPGARILPVLCGSFHDPETGELPMEPPEEAERFIDALRIAVETSDKSLFTIASADLSHVGPRFGDAFRIEGLHPKRIELEDRTFLEGFQKGDRRELYRILAGSKNRNHICGYGAIYTLMGQYDPCRGLIRSYKQWLDPEGTVSFAGGLLYRADD